VVITATVLNLPKNAAGVTVANTGSATYASLPGGARKGPITSNTTFQLVEPQLAIAKGVATPRSPVGASDTVTYTLVVTNVGTSPAFEATITDSLPAGVAFVATKQLTDTNPVTATLGGNYPSWTVSQLNVGGVVTVAFTAQVDANIGAGVVLTNTARTLWTSLPGVVADERSYTSTLVSAVITTAVPAGLGKVESPNPATIGQQVVYTLTIPTPPLIDTLYDVFFTDTVTDCLKVSGVWFVGGVGGVNTRRRTATM